MHSWQANVLLFGFRLKRRLLDRPEELDVEKDRRELESMPKLFKPLGPIECTPLMANQVPAEWIKPQGLTTDRVILYLHGGSWNSGSINSHRPLAANIAIACKARALIIDYRLAPEFPFPAANEDALAAYEWLLENGIAAEKIAIMGDSAGGTLTLGLLIQLRDMNKPLPALAVCLSPASDFSMTGESWTRNRKKDIMLNFNNIRKAGEIYLKDADIRSALISPLGADLHGLPTLLIQVGSDELLLSDAKMFIEKAREAGVPATLEVWDGMQHVWQYTASFVPEARRAIQNIGAFARRTWGD
jgi:monoterpene epsilon-lactone hydrolase